MTDPVGPRARQLAGLGVCNLVDGGADLLPPRLRPTGGPTTIAGPAATVEAPGGDNLAVQVALASCPPGAVLVISCPHGSDTAYWGELMTVSALQRGVAGVVCDGPVRDTAATKQMGFGVWAASICAAGPTKLGGGSVDVPVRIGGVEIRPGDWICADEDGACVIAFDRMDPILAAAIAKAEAEPAYISALRDGSTTLEVFGLDVSAVRIHPLEGTAAR